MLIYFELLSNLEKKTLKSRAFSTKTYTGSNLI